MAKGIPPLKTPFVPREATVTELEQEAADAEQQVASEMESRATELRQ
jgi:hypothetical protein